MKKISIVIGCLLLSGCWVNEKKLEKPKEASLVVLNVLDKKCYDDCHIKGSINVALSDIDQFARTLGRDDEVIVYCSNYQCTASAYVAKRLKLLGYNNIWVYEGGMAEWFQKKFPVEGPSKASYLTKLTKKPTADNQEEILTISAEDLALKIGINNVPTELAA